MEFTKMHGIGNDYVFFNLLDHPETEEAIDWAALSRAVSDRHKGVGSDGIILILRPREKGQFRMRIFNADGSEGEMCGNGIRCLGRFVYDHGYTGEREFDVETKAGLRHLQLHIDAAGYASEVTVDMGVPQPIPMNHPVVIPLRDFPGGYRRYAFTNPPYDFWVGAEVTGIPISLGNPHLVVFVAKAADVPVESAGPVLEVHRAFPNRTNVEFVETLPDERRLLVRVWERGSGETQACGTGACAAAVAAIVGNEFRDQSSDRVTVSLPGGDLEIRWRGPGEHLFMRGPAEEVYSGRLAASFLAAVARSGR